MKLESYQKQTVICLEEIAIKLKEKTGFEEGVDLCKLLYLRLLNVLEFNLPYINLLEQFRYSLYFIKRIVLVAGSRLRSHRLSIPHLKRSYPL